MAKAKGIKKAPASIKKASSKVGSIASGLMGGKKSSSGRKRRGKRSALWYLKNIARLKAKRRYDRERMRV